MNPEQTLADIEKAHDEAKEARRMAYRAFRAAKGRYHIELMARRSGGEIMTVADMKAYEDAAIDLVPYVKESYLALNEANIKEDQMKRALNEATRDYWQQRDSVRSSFR